MAEILGLSKSIFGFGPVNTIPGAVLWLDGSDSRTMFQNTAGTTPVTAGGQAVQRWNDKSGRSNDVTGTGTWSGSNMVFNGTTNAFSNASFVFPVPYSLFAVYSNTVAPAAGAYMNVVYGGGGFPMLGTFGSNGDVTARSVVANTGALLPTTSTRAWVARIAGTGTGADVARGIATDPSGNVLVTGDYSTALTIYSKGPTTTAGTTLPFIGGTDVFIAKYSSIGDVLWAARIAGTTTSGDLVNAIATDSSGNVLVTGFYSAGPLTLYNQGPTGAAGTTLPFSGVQDCFIAKYLPDGTVSWAARIASTANEGGNAIATDPSGNVVVTGFYTAALTIYNQGPAGTAATTLQYTSGVDVFVAKYLPDGTVSWAARIAGTSADWTNAIATDSSGNVLVTGFYESPLTIYNQGPTGAAGTTLPYVGNSDCFIAKYSSAGAVVWAARIASTGAVSELGYGIATDSLGNVLVTGTYAAPVTIYNQGPTGTAGTTLSNFSFGDVFIAKYLPDGTVSWAARIASGAASAADDGRGIAVDSSGNVLVTGNYSSTPLNVYNQGPTGSIGATITATNFSNCFIAKYSSAGAVVWATQIQGTGFEIGRGIAVDSLGSVLVTGTYTSAMTLSNAGGTAGPTLQFIGGTDIFIAKYTPDGFITPPAPASSNVLVDATMTTFMSVFINGIATPGRSGITVATTGVFVGGPSNYFNGTLSELLIYNIALTASQREAVEGYLANKWSIQSNLLTTQPYYTIPPFSRYFVPTDTGSCSLWMDGSDNSTMNSTSAVTIWRDKSGSGNTMRGSGTWSGSNMVFNGTTNAFSNNDYVFPNTAYSLFAVYSNTVAPAAAAYMNVMYGSNGFPMLGTFGVNRDVTARSVVANTGALRGAIGWVASMTGPGNLYGRAITTDTLGNALVAGDFDVASPSFFNVDGTVGASLTRAGASGTDAYIAKYTPGGTVAWVAQIAGTLSETLRGIASDASGSMFVTGSYNTSATFYDASRTNSITLAASNDDAYIAKYLSTGTLSWVARISGTNNDDGRAVATDASGNVIVTGGYFTLLSFYNAGGASPSGTTLANIGGNQNAFIAKYTSAGVISWAARISNAGSTFGQGISTDSSGNVFITGYYNSALTFSNASQVSNASLAFSGGTDVFIAKYTSVGGVSWATRIASTLSNQGLGLTTDTSGNVFVTGRYSGTATFYNSNTTSGGTLTAVGAADCFVVKYTTDGVVSWIANISGPNVNNAEVGNAIDTDASGNVLVAGYYGGLATFYNANTTTVGATLALGGILDNFVVKYTPAGLVTWAIRIVSRIGQGFGVAADASGNVFVTGYYSSGAPTFYNVDGTIGGTLTGASGSAYGFVAKYTADGYISLPIPASSNVLVDTTYASSIMRPFINGATTASTLAGDTLATTGIFLGGPSNFFNGTLSELLIYSATLTTAQRQQVEGYLLQKWGLRSQMVSSHPYLTVSPSAILVVSPLSVSGCSLWMDGSDNSTMNSTSAVTIWRDKSGLGNTMQGSGTWSGSNMVFNGTTNAFSNITYDFPANAYSFFAVYSNTVAPAASAFMNVMYGSNTYPRLGTFGDTKDVSVMSLAAAGNVVGIPVGWAARITSGGTDRGSAIAADTLGNVFVTGQYTNTLSLSNAGGTVVGATLPFIGGTKCFIAKYSDTGRVLWAAQIAASAASGDVGYGIATDSLGNVIVTGQYSAATVSIYNAGGAVVGATLPFTGGVDCFIAKYSSIGNVVWAARIASRAAGFDIGYAVAADPAGNVFVTGNYSSGILDVYNAGGTVVAVTLPSSSAGDAFVAKYSPTGTVEWAAHIVSTADDTGYGIASDTSGNVFVTGQYTTGAVTLSNATAIGGAYSSVLANSGSTDIFVAKYSSVGLVLWAARISGTGTDIGLGIATDASGNVYVTGLFNATVQLSNATTIGGLGFTLTSGGGQDAFVAKYSSVGLVLWAAQITGTGSERGNAISTDSSGNIIITGSNSSLSTFYNANTTTPGATLSNISLSDAFVAKYSSAGLVLWATRIANFSSENGLGVTTDPSGNIFVSGENNGAVTFYNSLGASGVQIPSTGTIDCFIAKYTSDGYIAIPVPASSNVLVDATYTPPTLSPFINGTPTNTLPGFTSATIGLFLGGPSNPFNGTLSELIIYSRTLTTAERQQVEGYLAAKWRITLSAISPYSKLIPALA
jgi:hypothetical protein